MQIKASTNMYAQLIQFYTCICRLLKGEDTWCFLSEDVGIGGKPKPKVKVWTLKAQYKSSHIVAPVEIELQDTHQYLTKITTAMQYFAHSGRMPPN